MLTSCMPKRITFIDLEKQADLKRRHQIVDDSAFLKNGIYLNVDFYSDFIGSDSIVLKKEIFIIDKNDKTKVLLSRNYENTKEILEPIDVKLIEYFYNNFGIENPDKIILKKSLVYKERIYVEFVSESAVSAFVLELFERNIVMVELAFILID